MTKIKNICLLTLLFAFVVSIPTMDAQRKRKRKKRADKDKVEIPFKDRLWYGGGFVLGFASSQDQSQFTIGVSPMAGYKVTENFSFGPRIELQYSTWRIQSLDEVFKYHGFNYGVGAFTRYKFFQTFFVHGELGYLNFSQPDFSNVRNGDDKIPASREGETQALIGLGYNSSAGSLWGTELSLMYDFLAPEDSAQLPLVLRFGMTYAF